MPEAKVQLRDYQQRCVDTVISSAKGGIRGQIIVLATGTGKTIIFSHLPSIVKAKGKKTLIIAHREELLDQAREKLLVVDPTLKIAIEQGDRTVEDEYPDHDHDVTIASVQTIGRSNSNRIKKFNPDDYGLIIIDEAHHAVASTYTNVLKHFDVLKGQIQGKHGRVLLGVTATPDRADHEGLNKVFDKMTFSYPLRQAIQDGYLVDIEAYDIKTKTDLSEVHTRAGDFVGSELAEAVNTPERNQLVVESYAEIAPGAKAICFAADIEHTKELTKYFNFAGYNAEFIIGDTPSEERKLILARFKSGQTRVLVNCAVLTEGFDEPTIEVVLMARPTKSSVMYSQMIGRGTRLSDGKESLRLIDFVDNVGRNKTANIYGLLNLPKKKLKDGMKQGKLLLQYASQVEKILDADPNYDVESIDDWTEEGIEKIIQQINFMPEIQLPKPVLAYSRFAWDAYMDGYRVTFPHSKDDSTREYASIIPDMLSQWQIKHVVMTPAIPTFKNGFRKWEVSQDTHIGMFSDLKHAFDVADGWITANRYEFTNLLRQDSKWREDKPTDAQLKLMRKLHINAPANVSKGQASVLISKRLDDNRKTKATYFAPQK